MDAGVRHGLDLPVVSMSSGGNFPPNASALPPWPTGAEGYDGMHTRALYPSQPAIPAALMQQTVGNYSGEMRPSHPGYPTAKRRKSRNTIKRRPQMSTDNNSVMHAAQVITGDMPMMGYVPNSSNFMMPMPQPITYMPNPYLPQTLQNYVQGVPVTLHHAIQGLPMHTHCQQLSHPIPQTSLPPTTAAVSSMAGRAMSAPTQLAPLGDPADFDWTLLDNLDQDDFGYTSGSKNVAREAQQVTLSVQPVSQSRVLSADNSTCTQGGSNTHCQPQQVSRAQIRQATASVCTSKELKQAQTTQYNQTQGMGVPSTSSIPASDSDQPVAPLPVPEKVVKSPPPCKNASEGRLSPSITTLTHHSEDQSSKLMVSNNRDSTSQAYITSNSSTIMHKPDQRPESPNLSQDDPINKSDDECNSDFCEPEKFPDQADATEEVLRERDGSLLQYSPRKRSPTALQKSDLENENIPSPKVARKDSDLKEDSLIRRMFIILKQQDDKIKEQSEKIDKQNGLIEELMDKRNKERGVMEELMEGQRATLELLKNMDKKLDGLPQQVKRERFIKEETRSSCQMTARLEESSSNGIKGEDCCWDGKNLLLKIIKLDDPCKCALKLLDELFTVEEMVGSCYKRMGDKPRSSSQKPLLDENRVKIIENCIKYRFGECDEDEIIKKCNQKCYDAKKRLK